MHDLLKEQIKDNLGEEFDFSMFADKTQLLLEDIANSYAKYDETTQQLKDKIEREEKYNHMLFNSQDNVVFTMDSINGLTSVNEKFFETFDFDSLIEFQCEHKCLCELFIEKDGFLSPPTLMDVSSTEWIDIVLENPELEHRALIKNRAGINTIFKVLISSLVLNNEPFMIVNLIDVTVIEEAKEMAETSEKLKSTFMANMSHEIRTPMNGIFGFTKLLRNSPLNHEQQRFTKLIEHSTHTLLKLVDDILDFSKIESGKLELDLVEVNPFTELRSAATVFLPKAKEKNINYRIHIDAQISECLSMDNLRVSQILTNLLNNALKFTAIKGTIDLRIEKLENSDDSKETLKFSVEDTGIGIAEERLKSIFKSFIQADSSTTRNFGGSGLGLTISASLCALMGSELKVTSVEGEGSCFYFVVSFDKCEMSNTLSKQILNPPIYLLKSYNPMFDKVALQLKYFKLDFVVLSMDELMNSDKKEHIAITFESWNCQPLLQNEHNVILVQEDLGQKLKDELDSNVYHIESFSDYPSELYNAILELNYTPNEEEVVAEEEDLQLEILIAEDYDINRILINEMLLKYNLIPDFAINGEEAVLMAQQKDYDLVLMDINMPVLNGIDATTELRELGINTPIVALTANALEGDREHFLSVGMDDYISKPINPQSLHTVLVKYSNEQETEVLPEVEEVYELENILASLKSAKDTMHFNNAILVRLFESFMNNTTTIVEEVTAAMEKEDKEAVKAKMHGLRGILRSLQINDIADMCEKLEYSDESFDLNAFWSLTIKVLTLLKSIHGQEEEVKEGISHLD
ncbi:MAG: Unknown protein [uncultured Sulfurovum sp.]|uniref:Sensory/regulatory protein RpfC n=1 Tax=uncultured Sulfurovum sp. TaxID=269237 RepID=A0A6S6S263_9BACT|nr:MAG: Unknown protein [uncultured Sulfurovum sp.]